MVKAILAGLAGIVAAVAIVAGGEGLIHIMFPPPPGTDLSKPEDLARISDLMPVQAKAAVLGNWFLATLLGSALALKLSASAWPFRLVPAVIIAGSIFSFVTIPHPAWMIVLGLVLPVVAASVAWRMFGRDPAL